MAHEESPFSLQKLKQEAERLVEEATTGLYLDPKQEPRKTVSSINKVVFCF